MQKDNQAALRSHTHTHAQPQHPHNIKKHCFIYNKLLIPPQAPNNRTVRSSYNSNKIHQIITMIKWEKILYVTLSDYQKRILAFFIFSSSCSSWSSYSIFVFGFALALDLSTFSWIFSAFLHFFFYAKLQTGFKWFHCTEGMNRCEFERMFVERSDFGSETRAPCETETTSIFKYKFDFRIELR